MKIDNGLERWLPISFTFGPSMTTVRWIDFGTDPIAEPFFGQTVRKLRSTEPSARERTTDLSALMTIASQLAPVSPAGLIFHVSRCGSSLVANALRTGDGVTVLSEARPIGTFFRPDVFKNSPFPAEGWEEARRMLLDCIVRIYAHSARTHDPKLVIKCHAASLLQISLIRSVWPTVPFLVLIRDPVEVMVSNLAKPATWLRSRNRPIMASKIFGWPAPDVQRMSAEEYCARGIGRFCECASRLVGDYCRVIDYEHLDICGLYSIASFFNIPLPPCSLPVIQQVLSTHAKDPKQMRPFEDDRERKQREATEATRESAQKWAYGPYHSLKAMESSQFAPHGRTV